MPLRYLVLPIFVLLIVEAAEAQALRRGSGRLGRGITNSGMRGRTNAQSRFGRNSLEIPTSRNSSFRALSPHEAAAEKQRQSELAHQELVKAIKEGRIDPSATAKTGRRSQYREDSYMRREEALEVRRIERAERARLRDEMIRERKNKYRSRKNRKEENEDEDSLIFSKRKARELGKKKEEAAPPAASSEEKPGTQLTVQESSHGSGQ
jgi:hypothetical protein